MNSFEEYDFAITLKKNSVTLDLHSSLSPGKWKGTFKNTQFFKTFKYSIPNLQPFLNLFQNISNFITNNDHVIAQMKEILLHEQQQQMKQSRPITQLNLSFFVLMQDSRKLGDDGIRYLSQEKWAQKLNSLSLMYNNLTCEGLSSLSSGNWTQLKHLNLSKNKIGNEGMYYLKYFPSLEELDLFDCNLSDQGIKDFGQISLPLRQLYLGQNYLKDISLEYLNGFQDLTHLDLSGNKLTGAGLYRIYIKEIEWRHLRILWINYIYFDSYGKEILQKLDGDRKYLQIVSDYGPKWI